MDEKKTHHSKMNEIMAHAFPFPLKSPFSQQKHFVAPKAIKWPKSRATNPPAAIEDETSEE